VRAAGRYIGKTWIGQKAPNFTQENLEGDPVSLSDLKKGKYILLDFWASWCAPCIDEIPVIQKVDSLYGNKNLDVIGISWDFGRQAWIDAVKKYDMDWVQLTDLKGYSNQLGQQFGIPSIPASILLDPDGVIIAKNIRGEELLSVLSHTLN
jgi:thiol-disulfide isomerase/thioredoxin